MPDSFYQAPSLIAPKRTGGAFLLEENLAVRTLRPLELAFSKKSLRDICEDDAHAKHHLGLKVSAMLRKRLADMRAAAHVDELVVGSPHELNGSNADCYSVGLCDGFRIIFCANHTIRPLTHSGHIDWLKVSRIKIVEITDEIE